jgi:hypothetical protein
MECHQEPLSVMEGSMMELGATVLVSNGLMAAMIYFFVSWIWKD